MSIIIEIKNRKIKIILLDKKKKIDFWEVEDEYQLSEDLLPAIDKLLKRNGISPQKVAKIEVKSDQEDSFTTTRIAASVANTWNGVDKIFG